MEKVIYKELGGKKMFKYITSVIIFYIVLKASISICKVILNNNGRLEKINSFNKIRKGITPSILITACIPIFRLIVVLTMYYICFCSEKQFNEIFEED